MEIKDIRIRDPYVYLDKETGLYYIYGTTNLLEGLRAGDKFHCYTSYDLIHFDGPFVIFDSKKEGFWGTQDFWAAELHKYNNRFYLIGSAYSTNHKRASQIFIGDTPLGPFKVLGEVPQTVNEWECLDGTLYFEDNIPYLVFCHEWLECGVGEIWAVELSNDLSKKVGEPFMLFKASDNKFTRSIKEDRDAYVTDGPFLFKEDNKLKMIWSSFVEGNRYVVLEATSTSIKGKWEHSSPRFDFDGGHAMIFVDKNGKRFISLHSPNTPPNERMKFIPFDE